MNFVGKGIGMDCIVSFAPAVNDMKNIRPGIYKRGSNEIIDKIVFNREKGAKLNIQASNFEVHRVTPCPKRITRRDPNPYLRNVKVKALDGRRHITHYPESPDAPAYVRAIFNAANAVEVSKTAHGGWNIACAVNGDIKKFADGKYSLDSTSLKRVDWDIELGTLKRQLEITKAAKLALASTAVEADENATVSF